MKQKLNKLCDDYYILIHKEKDFTCIHHITNNEYVRQKVLKENETINMIEEEEDWLLEDKQFKYCIKVFLD